jgi:hypothetical protein
MRHAEAEHEPLALAVLRGEADAPAHHLARRGSAYLLPVDDDRPLAQPLEAEDRAQELGPPGSEQSRDAEHLPSAQVEAHVLELALEGEVPHREGDVFLGWAVLEDRLVQRPPDYHPRHPLGRGVRDRERVDNSPVAQNGQVVGDARDFLHPVGYVDHGHSLLGEAADEPEQGVDLVRGERARGLVQDQHLRSERDGLRDLDDLLLGHGQPACLLAQVEALAELLKCLDRVAHHRPPVDHAGNGRSVPAPEHDVLGHAQAGDKAEFLIDGGDAVVLRVRGCRKANDFVPQPDFAGIGLGGATEDLHERRLARAVLAEQRAYLAALEAEVDAV